MTLRMTIIAVTSAFILGLLGAALVPTAGVAACKDPPGGTDCR